MLLKIKEFWSKRAWPWIKAHPWQAALFPLTLLAFLVGAYRRREKEKDPLVVVPPKQDIVASEQRHEVKLEELHQKAQELLVNASEAQVAEYKELQKKGTATPAEVAKWIDQF